jgi:hypothetical protein
MSRPIADGLSGPLGFALLEERSKTVEVDDFGYPSPYVRNHVDAADYSVEVLGILFWETVAVTIHPQHGEPFGAVLVSNDAKTLVYEEWNKQKGQPSGVPQTIAIDQIDEVAVF